MPHGVKIIKRIKNPKLKIRQNKFEFEFEFKLYSYDTFFVENKTKE